MVYRTNAYKAEPSFAKQMRAKVEAAEKQASKDTLTVYPKVREFIEDLAKQGKKQVNFPDLEKVAAKWTNLPVCTRTLRKLLQQDEFSLDKRDIYSTVEW